MLDDLRRFSTDAYPEALRPAAWAEVLGQLGLACDDADAARPSLDGYVSARRSSLGSVFARFQTSPQVWQPQRGLGRRPGSAVLLVGLLEGSALATEGHETVALAPGDSLLLDPAAPWRLDLHMRCRAVVLKLESASVLLRLVRGAGGVRPGPAANRVPGGGGVGGVVRHLVRAIADELDRLGPDDLLPLESSLTEVLMGSLAPAARAAPAAGPVAAAPGAIGAAAPSGAEPAEDATATQLALLRRVCRRIEDRLGDAALTLDDLARDEGLSPRYVQKLLQGAGTRFGEYLKTRRLERCRLDLANRALAGCTIAELCFRWGFGDAANFSRAFTARYGVSPKAYRAAPPADGTTRAGPTQRGAPASIATGPHASREEGPSRPTRPSGRPFEDVLADHERYARALALAPKRAAASPPGSVVAAGIDVPLDDRAALGAPPPRAADWHYIPVSDRTVHWGYLSRSLAPVISVRSGDVVTIETLTQHAGDDRERMIDGDAGAESVFRWTAEGKAVERRGAGPMDASVYGRGAGEGFGVHICTGPVHVRDAEPGDVLEVRILDIRPRRSCHPQHRGRVFGSNVAAWWGYQYQDLLTEPKPREVVTLYEIHADAPQPHATALYRYRWTPQTDPQGVRHPTIDYPGVIVDPATVERQCGVLGRARVPVRPHFGLLAVAPKEPGLVDSVPPGYFGGNLDNWRAAKGARVFLPIAVDGALFSVGDPHASQGDAEVCGTAIECSLTGVFQLVLHKREALGEGFLAGLNHPFLETDEAWVVQGFSFANHLAELGAQAQTEVYRQSSLDLAMRDAFRKTRRYLMTQHGLDEDEALSLMSVGVDFGVTQVADGNWGVHAVIARALLPDAGPTAPPAGLASRLRQPPD